MENACTCLKDTAVSQGKSTSRESKKEQEKICTGMRAGRREDDYLGEGVTKLKQSCPLLLCANSFPTGIHCCWLHPVVDFICPLYRLSACTDTTA